MHTLIGLGAGAGCGETALLLRCDADTPLYAINSAYFMNRYPAGRASKKERSN